MQEYKMYAVRMLVITIRFRADEPSAVIPSKTTEIFYHLFIIVNCALFREM